MRPPFGLPLIWCLLDYGFLCLSADEVLQSVMEGNSITLHTNVTMNKQDKIKWYFNKDLIARINGDQSKICTDDKCKERFRDRLKLDHQTGSLTITNTRTTDSGDYELKIISSSSEKTFSVTVHSASGVDTVVLVFVMEGDSVALHTNVKINQQEKIKWYFNDTLIAQITGNQSKICTADKCKERFRDRLKLDHQTGSLTITNTRTTDSGDYEPKIISSSSSDTEDIFRVSVHGVSASKQDEMKRKSVKAGESVTLDSGVITPNYLLTWDFNEVLIAEITGDQSKICTDDECKERFRDRLKLDQTGSLTITNTTTTDSGLYILQINSSRFNISRSFSVTVIDPDSSSGSATIISVGVVVGGVLLVVAVAAVIYRHCRRSTQARPNGTMEQCNDHQENGGEQLPLNEQGTSNVNVENGSSHNQSATSLMTADNGLSPKKSKRIRRRKQKRKSLKEK